MSNIVDLYPHNKKVYIEVIKNLKSHNKVGVVQATGTGKGKLAACFVERVIKNSSTAKVLVVAPNLSILQNYRDNFGIQDKRIIFSTYSNLINKSESDLEKVGETFSLIILDEFHRAGAKKWMIAINSIFKGVDKGNCKVIGLTATPKRFLDKSRDMGDELFDGNIIKGLDLGEAIIDGILPGFIYNACYFGAENKLKELEKKLESEDSNIINDTVRNDLLVKVKELALIYKNRLKVENIIKEGTKELGENQKWLIFCRDINSLNQIREFCKSWFNYKPNIFIMNSKKAPEDNDRILKEFREVKKGVNVLLCVNMLNEGVHIKDLNGVIMMRQTESPILFLQQLGRALETGKDFKPIIFDLIGNYRGLTAQFEDIEGNPVSIVRGIETKTKGHKNYVIVHSFMEEMDNVLDEIDIVCSIFWTKEEDDFLIKYGKGCTVEEATEKIVSKNVLNRTRIAIEHRLRKLGCCIMTKKYWTDDEIEILKKYYPIGGAKLCQEKGLSYRTRIEIAAKAQDLGIYVKTKNWASFENNIIIQLYPEGGPELCQKNGLEHRTIGAIKGQAIKLGIQYKENIKIVSNFDKEIIKNWYPIGGPKLCIEKGITDRDEGSITRIAFRMGVKRDTGWTEEKINILKKFYPIGGPELCQKKE